MAFICWGAAEMNRSQSAPSLICLSRVPEESKLYVTVTLGLFCSYISLSWFMVSVIEAAANTISSTGSPAGASVGALSCVWEPSAALALVSALEPQAARDRVRHRASSRDKYFFMLVLPS